MACYKDSFTFYQDFMRSSLRTKYLSSVSFSELSRCLCPYRNNIIIQFYINSCFYWSNKIKLMRSNLSRSQTTHPVSTATFRRLIFPNRIILNNFFPQIQGPARKPDCTTLCTSLENARFPCRILNRMTSDCDFVIDSQDWCILRKFWQVPRINCWSCKFVCFVNCPYLQGYNLTVRNDRHPPELMEDFQDAFANFAAATE
jgi:hypothetical protein